MTESEFLKYALSGKLIKAGSPVLGPMHSRNKRALRLTLWQRARSSQKILLHAQSAVDYLQDK